MQKIVFITQRDPFFVDSFFREFLKYDYEVTIFDLPNFNRGKLWALRRATILYGLYGIMKLSLLRVRYWLSDTLNRNKIVALKLEQLPDIGELSELQTEKSILVSLSAPQKIPLDWLNAFDYALNIHCGALPTYAGMMPIFWQAYNSEKDVTITIHHMAEEIDAGGIIDVKKFPFCGTLYETSVRAKQLSAQLLHEVLQRSITSDCRDYEPLKPAVLRKFPSRDEVRTFRKKLRLI